MIKAHDVQTFFARVFLAAHQFFRANQKTISFRFFRARVGNWISLDNLLAAVVESSEHQTATLEGIVALAVRAHLVLVLFFKCDQIRPSNCLPQRRGDTETTSP